MDGRQLFGQAFCRKQIIRILIVICPVAVPIQNDETARQPEWI